MDILKNFLVDILVVVGLIVIIFVLIWLLLEILNNIFHFTKYIVMYNKYKEKEDLYDLRNKVIVSKDGEVSYSCAKDIGEEIEILNKGIKYCEKMKHMNERLTKF